MTVYTTLPTDDLNLAVTVTDDPDLVVLNITPAAVDLTGAVDSVNTQTGDVVLGSDNIAEGSNNLYYTNARADARVNLQTGANLDLSFSDTDDLAEGPTNLYYTDSRAQTVITNNTEGFIKATALTPYYTKTQTDALPVSTFTNDAGYITSETDSQTLSFTTPNLTISNGNSVNLTPLKTTALAFSAITATPTTVAGYGITDAFDGAYNSLTGKPSLFDGVFASLTSKPTTIAGYGITDAFSGAYADLSGKPTIPTNNNELSNGAAYITAGSTETLTNKSGNISMFTNDSGYLTAETDSQTLSFTSPNLSISNGNSQDLSALTDGGTY